MARRGERRAGRWPVQVRLRTNCASDDYVSDKLWHFARLPYCPFHPRGGCRLARHGTYARVEPPGARIARWYCPRARRTVSALPDCLASHQRGTLAEVGATVGAIERAGSLAAAAETLRPEIELPGALRFLGRLRRRVQATLAAIRGLDPDTFAQIAPTLGAFAVVLGVELAAVPSALRAHAARHLSHLPTPIGFAPRRIGPERPADTSPHRAGRDPPGAFVEARVLLSEHRSR